MKLSPELVITPVEVQNIYQIIFYYNTTNGQNLSVYLLTLSNKCTAPRVPNHIVKKFKSIKFK